MSQVNLNEMSVTELKALAYDEGVRIDQARQNLALLSQAIDRKSKEVQQKIEEVPDVGQN